jgi:hypothetical protein
MIGKRLLKDASAEGLSFELLNRNIGDPIWLPENCHDLGPVSNPNGGHQAQVNVVPPRPCRSLLLG